MYFSSLSCFSRSAFRIFAFFEPFLPHPVEWNLLPSQPRQHALQVFNSIPLLISICHSLPGASLVSQLLMPPVCIVVEANTAKRMNRRTVHTHKCESRKGRDYPLVSKRPIGLYPPPPRFLRRLSLALRARAILLSPMFLGKPPPPCLFLERRPKKCLTVGLLLEGPPL